MTLLRPALLVPAVLACGTATATAPGAPPRDIPVLRAAPAPAPAPAPAAPTEFPRPESLLPAVGFWRQVLAGYSEYQSVVHSMDEAHRVYAVLDFRDEAARLGPERARALQRKAEREAKKDVDRLLRRAHELRDDPARLDPEARAVWALFADREDPDRYRKAVGRFRAQRGLKEATERALRVSGRYLPRMEAIFEAEGLPRGLTRLPLVESSFNVDAYSKAGAAGLWQFIPSSARVYMRLDEAVDERRDPWASTRAAAQHLKDDYEALGTWPLAVTAYNYGRVGLARGLREVRGSDLTDLLERWDGRRFGFASRNFYAEFLAAVDVERDYREHFGEIERYAHLEFEAVPTDHYVAYDVLQRIANVDRDTFRQLNPGFRPEVLDGRLYVPPQTRIRVPPGQAQAFRAAYDALGDDERFDQQRFYYVRYRVQRGDTIGGIAERYGVRQSELLQANGIGDPRRLRAGQVIRVPPRNHGGVHKVAAVPEAVPSDGLGYLMHHVRPGQSLYTIARQYRTTIEKLRELNGLDEGHLLMAGTRLKVPAR